MTRRWLAGMMLLAAGACGSDTAGGEFDAPPGRADAFVFPTFDAAPVPDAAVQADAMVVPDAAIADARDGGTTADAAPTADARPLPDAGVMADAGATTCFNTSGVQTITTSTIFNDQTYSGARNEYVFNSNLCSDAPDSVERIYTFELSSPLEWHAETRCGWDCELVLTRTGCTDADVVSCATSFGEEAMGSVLTAGRYALFVEGDNPEDPGAYDLMVNFNHTAGDAQCAAKNVEVINPANCEDPFFDEPNYHLVLSNEETTLADVDDFYVEDVDGCDHDQDHVGGAPDKVYKLVLPERRDVEITLDPLDWDGMLYVTGSPCGARTAVKACSDDATGSTEEIGLTLDAGTWYIIVDGFGEEVFDANAWGIFDLDIKVYDDFCNE